MNQYSLNRLYNNFLDTFNHCGSFLFYQTDDAIMHHLFEEFSIDVVSFFHENSLNILMKEMLINEEIYFACLKIREMYMNIEMNMPQLLNAKSVRESETWKLLFDLSDKTYLKLLKWNNVT